MKIRLLIHNGYAGGGTVRTTMNNAGALRARGHDVEVISVYRRRESPAIPVPRGVLFRPLVDIWTINHPDTALATQARGLAVRGVVRAVNRIPPVLYSREDSRRNRFNLLGEFAMYRYIRSVRDGVLVGTRPGINLAITRFGRSGAALVGQDHLNLAIYPEGLKEQIRRSYGRLDAVVSLTEGDAADYRGLLGEQTRVLAIPNAMPDLGGRRATYNPDGKLVVAVGRLTRQKGFDLLLKAWATVTTRHPDWRLEIYGSGNDAALQGHIDRRGIGETARLMGHSEAVWDVLTRASLFVLSSRFEGFPMALLEAMGMGLPVVSFDCPTGPRDLIEDGRNGYLVAAGDVGALAERICDLIEDPARRQVFGAAAATRAPSYDLAALAVRWEELFDELTA